MNDYFKPRRRKVGVVTLLTACLVLAAWVRGQHIQDLFAVASGSCFQVFVSDGRGITWRVEEQSPESAHFLKDLPYHWDSRPFVHFEQKEIDSTHARRVWSWRHGGIWLGEYRSLSDAYGNRRDLRWAFWQVPHWYFVGLMTILSACLLLGKSPTTKLLLNPQAIGETR